MTDTEDSGNPDPERIREWHVPNPYDDVECGECGEPLARGELVNIEYENGPMHTECSDPG